MTWGRTYIMGTFAGCETTEARQRRMVEALVALHRNRGDTPRHDRQYIVAYSPEQPVHFEIGWDETGLALAHPAPQSVTDAVYQVFGIV